MKIAIHGRGALNATNDRLYALEAGFRNAGLEVHCSERKRPVKGSDLVIQVGFGASAALKDACYRAIPYIIVEGPHFRDFYDIDKASSWGYNGLSGGAWRPTAPTVERPKPSLQPWKTEGGTLIVGQKPTDHSLRGSDHVRWLLDRFAELPEARFRPHPLMVPQGTLVPFERDLSNIKTVVGYNSTSAVQALVMGCTVRMDGPGNLLPPDGESREAWLHSLSWSSGLNSELGNFVPYILSGYEEALARSKQGLFEVPRERVDGRAICERYYRALISGAVD